MAMRKYTHEAGGFFVVSVLLAGMPRTMLRTQGNANGKFRAVFIIAVSW